MFAEAPDARTGPEAGLRGLITGGSAGLGLAIARAAVSQGMGVTLVARDEDRLQTAAESLRSAKPGASVATIAADLAEPGEATRVATEAQSPEAPSTGPLDFVCHAAGLSARGRLAATSREDHERLLAINYLAAAELVNALAESLEEQRGRLVLIGSLASRVAPPWYAGYAASKHAVAALAQQLRHEHPALRTLLVCPGPIARPDGGRRYEDQVADLPESARRPGGGAQVRPIDPDWLAAKVLDTSRRGRRELVVPRKARLLFALSQLNPAWGDWLLRRKMGG